MTPSTGPTTISDPRDADRLTNLGRRRQKARAAILADVAYKKRQDVNGALTCPVCGTGVLRYAYYGRTSSGRRADGRNVRSQANEANGHVHARCSTGGCVWWGE